MRRQDPRPTPYTIDVSLPDLLTAVVLTRRASARPRLRERRTCRSRSLASVRSSRSTKESPSSARHFADALRGLRALDVNWDDDNAERRSSEQLLAEHRRLIESGEKRGRRRRGR